MKRFWNRYVVEWRYWYRRYLGFIPIQFCCVCGKSYWAGWPEWSFADRRWQWLPWWGDYCSKSCCDDDMEFCESISISHRRKEADESESEV